MRILVVEDEKKVASFIKRGQEEEEFSVDVAYDGEEGVQMAEASTYDLILMDVMLPKKDGLSAIKELREKSVATPILCLTAKDTVEDIVSGLDIGSDDSVGHKVWRDNKEIDLTSKEYALLEYFMRSPNQVLTRTMIAEHVWDYTFDSFTNIIDVYVNYLRKKIDRDFDKKLIHTVRGVGYVLKESD